MAVRRVRSVHESPQLQRFIIENVRPTGRQLGSGSYGSVEELEVDGLICAGKKLHDALVEMGNAGVQDITQKFVEECQLMSGLRHPHIVQFLGICFLRDSNLPVLIMEYLLTSLDELLVSKPNIPLYLKRSILRDVACGLVYLHNHSPQIIHRDLTSKNVLLNSSMVAKIADLGVARILNLRPGQLATTMTQTPGTLAYMPPEALEENPKYNAAIDMFAFGGLSLFTVIQEFPMPAAPTYMDPDNPGMILGRSEVQRRARFIGQLTERLGGEHPLVHLITRCLQNDPRRRPSAREALQQLDEMKPQIEDPYEHVNKLEMIQTLGRKTAQIHQLEEASIHGIGAQSQVEQLQERSQLETKSSQLQQKLEHLDAPDTELETLKGEHQHGSQAEELLAKVEAAKQALSDGLEVQIDLRKHQLCELESMKAAKKSELEQAKERQEDIPDQKSLVSGSLKTELPSKPKPKPVAKSTSDSEGGLLKWWRERRINKRMEKEASRMSKEIDKQLRSLQKEEDSGLKILLLGQGESGKSTFINQMRFLHEPGWLSDERRLSYSYQQVIYHNTVAAMRILINALETPLSNPKNEKHKEMIMGVNTDFEFFPHVAQALKSLWEDESIQATVQHSSKFDGEYLLYFPNHLNRIGAKDYTPSVEDILHSRVQTRGVIEYEFHIKHMPFRFVDVGGVRAERRNWIQAFDGVSAVFFFVPSSGFDQTLFYDGRTNQLEEGVSLFDSVVNNKFFQATSFVVLFTKTDLLLEKIQRKNIKDHFPDFPGDPHNLDDVKQFLRTMFKSRCLGDNSSRVLGYHFIATTNTDEVKAVFDSALDAIIKT